MEMRSWGLLFLAAVAQLVLSEDGYRIVNLDQGPVKGYLEPEGDMFVFYHIPYATAPKGTNIFQAPLPAPKWNDTLEAVKVNNKDIICLQPMNGPEYFNNYLDIREDCLLTNIYIPNREESGLLPVLVIVHGGGFSFGFGEFLRPISLVKSKRIIGVIFNYRVGAYGFLCLRTKDAPGNIGLKDQVALLRWVRDNIKKFGGDPENVTVYGYSSGSTSVLLLTLSKSTEGLFHKAIAESGSDLAAHSVHPDPLKIAKQFVKQHDKYVDVNNIKKLEQFYKEAPLDVLSDFKALEDPDTTITYSPCVEKDLGQEMFLSDTPINILKSGKFTKVPLLYGITDLEGLARLHTFEEIYAKMNANFTDYLPGNIVFESEKQRKDFSAKIRRFYFGGKPIGPKTILNFTEYCSDIYYTIPTLFSIQLRLDAEAGPIYLYEYSYADNMTSVVPYTDVRGANHVAQSLAVLDTHDNIKLYNESTTEDYNKLRRIMREMWLNFIITGNPTPEATDDYPVWPAVTSYNSPYISLNVPLRLGTSLLERRFQLWNEIYGSHHKRFRKSVALTTGNAFALTQSNTHFKLIAFIFLFILNKTCEFI